jgi:hypothetical protein
MGLLVTGQAEATRLIFETEAGAGTSSPNYGDNVATSPQGGFSYGLEGGPTPNVAVDYIGNPLQWSTGYGDLTHIIYDGNDGTSIEVRLIAEPGYLVALHSFELAGYLGDFENVGVTVTDGNGVPLMPPYLGHVEGDGSSPDPQGDGNVHTDFDFGAPLVAPEIRISFDDSVQREYIGLDNVVFSQQLVPEPAAGLLVLAGSALVMLRRRA